MVLGQAIDLEGQLRALSLSELEVMHQRKTGALIEASLAMVARVVRDVDVERSLERFARHIGLAFQIRDDLLDVESSTTIIGKPVGSDFNKNKSTFVSLLGVDASKQRLQAELEQAHSVLDTLENNSLLRGLTDFIASRQY